ncbi:SDR family oxidoreductase [Legionella clemsonensis]|uniref:NAD dependent epimerase/dehydratase family protein n=1 Tax=Legionella clemsonensis TaxID=1867846 RepID=A0A222NYD6_9GAMM|nr:SDR family oxidoreductase [Legionella clemsonensis]ASQ44600.1 NAD dependent epimerase/dehydratase family protein [Legionella clemsonensis]
MKILILGATGFVGTWVTNALIEAGHEVHCAVRNKHAAKQKFPRAKIFHCDFLKDTSNSYWQERLDGVDVLINCVGIFYHYNKKLVWKVHYETPKTLFAAAEKASLKKIIHLSALGIDRYNNVYADSKLATEKFLQSLTVPFVILRPSFIYGPGTRGGISLIRSLAALPGVVPLPDGGRQEFQPIHISDLVQAIKNLILINNPGQLTLAAVSAKKVRLKEIILKLRNWLGLKPAALIKIPIGLIKLVALLGDYIPYSTVNTAAIAMLTQGNTTTQQEAIRFQEEAQVIPHNFAQGLHKTPAFEQDCWHAKLSYLRPLLRLSLAFMWIMSALTSSFFFSKQASYQLLATIGISTVWQPLFLYGASLINTLLGIGLLLNYKVKLNCLIQIAVISIYTLIISVALPYLWLEPFGPVVKNIPILSSIFILNALSSNH